MDFTLCMKGPVGNLVKYNFGDNHSFLRFLGAKAPLGPLQFVKVKVKVKPKSFKIEGFARILFLLLETVTSCMPRAKGYSSLFHGCSRVVQGCFMGISWVFYGYFSAFLGVFAYIKWNVLRVCPVSR